MSQKKFRLMLIFVVILSLFIVPVALAGPSLQTGDDTTQDEGTGDEDGASEGDSLNLDQYGNNLGSVMSGRNKAGDDDTGDTGEGDTGDEGDTGEGDTGDGDDGDTGEEGEDEDPEEGVKQHPVASALANFFEVPYDEIIDLHQAGNGFGNIAKAYFFFNKFDEQLADFGSPQEILDAAHGTGWGRLLKDNDIHPGVVGNGGRNRPEHAGPPPHVTNRNGNADVTEFAGPGGNNDNGNGNGRANGNGNGKGVGGRANDDPGGGNGVGNGNGQGQEKGKGHGNGNGRGRNK